MGVAPTIEGFRVQAVKGEVLPDEVRGLPLGREALRTIMFKVPIVVSDPSAELDSTDSVVDDLQLELGQYELSQPSEMHKRSFVVDHPDFQQTWQDEFGNQYSAISTKGNNFSQPGLHEHPTAAEGVIPFGLQESSIIERVLKASQFLRSKGISTEYIFGVTEPKEFPWPGDTDQDEKSEILSLEEYKRRIVMDYWTKLEPEKKTIEALGELHRQFEEMTFFVTFRATDSPYRLSDMRNEEVRRAVFEYANEKIIGTDNTPYDPDDPYEVVRYNDEIVAPRLGKNMARLHFAGLAHKFPHTGNITALGGIVDLDSVYGEPLGLGNDKIDFNNMAYDMDFFISSSCSAFMPRSEKTRVIGTMNAFMNSYADEIKQLSQTTDEARRHMAGVLYMMDLYADNNSNEHEKEVAESVLQVAARRFCDEYLDVDFNTRAATLRAMVDKAGDYYADEWNYSDAKDRVLRVLSELKNEIMTETLGEATSAYQEGVEFNAVGHLIKYVNSYTEQRELMIAEILDPYIKETVAKYRAEHQTPAELDKIDAALFELAEERLYEAYNYLLDDYGKGLLNERILPQLRNEVGKILKISVPENILSSRENSQLLEIDTVRSSYILASEIQLEDLLEDIGDVDIEQAVLEVDELETVLEASEGYRIDQIVMDSYFCTWHVNNNNGRMSIDGGFAEDPSYVLVVESNNSGDRKLRMLKNAG